MVHTTWFFWCKPQKHPWLNASIAPIKLISLTMLLQARIANCTTRSSVFSENPDSLPSQMWLPMAGYHGCKMPVSSVGCPVQPVYTKINCLITVISAYL